MAGDSNPTASIRPSASSDGVTDIVRDTTTTTSTSETTTTTSTDNILGTATTVTATGGSFLIDGIVTASTVLAYANTQSTTTLLMYGVIKDETSTSTPNILIVTDTTDTSDSVETTSSTDNGIVFDAESVSSISIPMTNTLFSTYFMSTSVTVTVPNKSLDSATMVDTGTAVAIPDLTDSALQKADTASGSSALGTVDTVPIPLGTTTACVTCYTTFTSSATTTSPSDSTDTTISGTYAPNEIISTLRLKDGTETSRGAPTTAAIPELIPRSAEPPCNLAVDCSFTARNERTFPSDIPMKPLLPDVSVMPELLSVPISDIPVEVPYSSSPLPDISCCDVPPTVPGLNISPSEEGQLNIALPDVPLFNETLQSKPFTNEPPPNSPLITVSSTQTPLYIILPNVPLPDKPLPAVSPKELRFDDPSTDVSLVDVLTPDIPSPADLPLLDIPPEVPRLDEIPPDTLPTYLSPVDVLTPDILSTPAVLLDIVPGTLSSKSQDNLREPLLDAVSAKVSVVSLLSSSEQVRNNTVPDKTIDQPDSVINLPPVKFNFSFVDVSKSFDPVLDSVPVFVDDPRNISDDSSAPTNNIITKPLESDYNSVLEQPNKNDKVNDEAGSMGLISSSQNGKSKNDKLDLTPEEESLVVQAEGQPSTVVSIQESETKGPEDKNTEDQNQETGTTCNSDW